MGGTQPKMKLTKKEVAFLATLKPFQQVALARQLADKTGQPVVLPSGCKVMPTHRASKAEESLMQAHLANGFTDD